MAKAKDGNWESEKGVSSLFWSQEERDEENRPSSGKDKMRQRAKCCLASSPGENPFHYPDEATSSFLLPAPIETMQQIRNYGIVSEQKFDQGWIHN